MQTSHLLILIVTLVVTLLPLVWGLCTWAKLPDTVAIHFGLDGKPNGWAPKWVVVFLLPLLLVVVQLILYFSFAGPVARGFIDSVIYHLVLCIVPICAVICTVIIYGKVLK